MDDQAAFTAIEAHIEGLSDRDNEMQAETRAALMAIAYLVLMLHARGGLDAGEYVQALRGKGPPNSPMKVKLAELANGIDGILRKMLDAD